MFARIPHRLASLVMLVALVTLPPFTAGAAQDNRESNARELLTRRVTLESNGVLTLTKFAKTNGYDKMLEGSKMYVLEWTANVTTAQEIWKPGNAIGGYWSSFAVFTQEPNVYDNLLGGGSAHFDAGVTFSLVGTTLFRLTDRGWRAEDIAVESYRVIPDAPKKGSTSPFSGVWRVVEHCDDCMKSEEALRVTEMTSGLYKFQKGMFDMQGRPVFESAFAFKPLLLRLTDGRLVGTSFESGVSLPVTLQLGPDGELSYLWGDFLPKKGPRVP